LIHGGTALATVEGLAAAVAEAVLVVEEPVLAGAAGVAGFAEGVVVDFGVVWALAAANAAASRIKARGFMDDKSPMGLPTEVYQPDGTRQEPVSEN